MQIWLPARSVSACVSALSLLSFGTLFLVPASWIFLRVRARGLFDGRTGGRQLKKAASRVVSFWKISYPSDRVVPQTHTGGVSRPFGERAAAPYQKRPSQPACQPAKGTRPVAFGLVDIFRSKLVKFLLMVEFMQILRAKSGSSRKTSGRAELLKWWNFFVPPEHLICHSRELLRVGNSEKWR